MFNIQPRKLMGTTTIHIMALDGIINVNSLFTLGLFLGLTMYPTTPLVSTVSCFAGPDIAEGLVAFHVYSFSSFLFSTLIASALKQAIKIVNGCKLIGSRGVVVTTVNVNLLLLRVGISVSSVGSVFGCGFLMMALVNFVQIKLGVLSCMSFYTLASVLPLVTLVPLALAIYVCLVLYAFAR